MNTPQYVLGFAFANPCGDRFVGIKKTKPEWQAGKVNGVGGKVEDFDKTSAQAMSREFSEETGVVISPSRWKEFCVFTETECEVVCFTTHLNDSDLKNLSSPTEEKVGLYHTKHVLGGCQCNSEFLPNLRWLVPMALDWWREPKMGTVVYPK